MKRIVKVEPTFNIGDRVVGRFTLTRKSGEVIGLRFIKNIKSFKYLVQWDNPILDSTSEWSEYDFDIEPLAE